MGSINEEKNQGQVEDKWENIKTAYKEVAEEVLGHKKGGNANEWLSEETRRLAEERRAARTEKRRGTFSKETSQLFMQASERKSEAG